MSNLKNFIGDIQTKISLRKISKERKKAEEEKRQNEKREKYEKKIWGQQEKICPECGSKLILRNWKSYDSVGSIIYSEHHGAHLYRIYYAQCINSKCNWQKRLYEEWS